MSPEEINDQFEAGTELERLNEEMKFRRQSGPITITITGEKKDLHNWFGKLYPWLHNQSANVDFHYDMNSLSFKVYPFCCQ